MEKTPNPTHTTITRRQQTEHQNGDTYGGFGKSIAGFWHIVRRTQARSADTQTHQDTHRNATIRTAHETNEMRSVSVDLLFRHSLHGHMWLSVTHRMKSNRRVRRTAKTWEHLASEQAAMAHTRCHTVRTTTNSHSCDSPSWRLTPSATPLR